MRSTIFTIVLVMFFVVDYSTEKINSWKAKSIMDMTDADMERLLDQWEENEEPLEADELPEHLRPSPGIDLSQIDLSNPDNLLKATKMGKSVMMFVDVRADFSDSEAENILRLWQGSLQNNHIVTERYPIEAKRAVFMFREGSQAIDGKNFFIEQPELERVTLEGQTYYGKKSSEENDMNMKKGTQKLKSDEL